MATEDAAGEADEDTPDLIIKLRERKERHKQRNIVHRAAIVVAGILIVCAGIVMSGPGVPGPGIVTIIFGLTFLALEFDRALARACDHLGRQGGRARRADHHETACAGGNRYCDRDRRLRRRGDPLGHPADAFTLISYYFVRYRINGGTRYE
jgi:hypothetical protein